MPNNLKMDFSSLDDIEIYELLLHGRISSFPSGFWTRSEGEAKEVAIKLLRYLIIEKLKFSKEDVKREVSKGFLTKYKLHTASKFFGRSAIRFILNAFPEEEYKPWQFKNDKVPQGYWVSKENRITALKYIFEVELKWSIEDIKEKLNWDILKQHGLFSLHRYYPSLCEIINAIYPDKIYPWELKFGEVSNYYWHNANNRTLAVRWLVLVILKLDYSQAVKNLKEEQFSYYKLSNLLSNEYNSSIIKALQEAFNIENGKYVYKVEYW